MLVCESGAKMMSPLRLQLPPRPNGASQSATADPPSKPIVLSFASAKKPRERPLGDQNGNVAPSVPAISSAFNFPNERTHIREDPFAFTATNASRVPSALKATDPPSSPIRFRVVPSGGNTNDLLEGTSDGFFSPNGASRARTVATGATQSNHR